MVRVPPERTDIVQSGLARFQETTSAESFALQNAKLLKVRLSQTAIRAKLGSMVAYTGNVTFEHSGSGVAKFVKKAVTSEGQALMKCFGEGDVFVADSAQDIQLFRLQGERLTVNGRNILAFEDGIEWDIERLRGAGAMMGGGLFNTKLEGSGWVAVVSDGPPVCLQVGAGHPPVYADPQAAVAWSSGVTTSLKTDFKAKNLIGLGSGETFQIAFGGEGWVLVQPSENKVVVPT